jgi:hypothetical protein
MIRTEVFIKSLPTLLWHSPANFKTSRVLETIFRDSQDVVEEVRSNCPGRKKQCQSLIKRHPTSFHYLCLSLLFLFVYSPSPSVYSPSPSLYSPSPSVYSPSPSVYSPSRSVCIHHHALCIHHHPLCIHHHPLCIHHHPLCIHPLPLRRKVRILSTVEIL